MKKLNIEVSQAPDVTMVGYTKEGYPVIESEYFNRKHDAIIITFPKGKPQQALYATTEMKWETIEKALKAILED